MRVPRGADYAARGILYLARVGKDERVATSQVAKEQKIPPSFLAKIISQLSIAGLLNTSRGAHGGIKLARNARDISLLEVIEAIDGPINLNMCVEGEGNCMFEENCPLRPVWCDARKELVTKLKNTTFAQLAA